MSPMLNVPPRTLQQAMFDIAARQLAERGKRNHLPPLYPIIPTRAHERSEDEPNAGTTKG